MADISLLIGYTDHSSKIGFKEMSKVINAMSGKGKSLPYVTEEIKGIKNNHSSYSHESEQDNETIAQKSHRSNVLTTPSWPQKRVPISKLFLPSMIILLAVLVAAIGSYSAFTERRTVNTLTANSNDLSKQDETQKNREQEKIVFVNKKAANIRKVPVFILKESG